VHEVFLVYFKSRNRIRNGFLTIRQQLPDSGAYLLKELLSILGEVRNILIYICGFGFYCKMAFNPKIIKFATNCNSFYLG